MAIILMFKFGNSEKQRLDETSSVFRSGESLMPHIDALAGWASEHLPAISAGRNAGRSGK